MKEIVKWKGVRMKEIVKWKDARERNKFMKRKKKNETKRHQKVREKRVYNE
jgi:hypothetical protein